MRLVSTEFDRVTEVAFKQRGDLIYIYIYIYIYTSVDLLIYISSALLDAMPVGCAVTLFG